MTRKLILIAGGLALVLLFAGSVFAGEPGGTNPDDALMVPTSEQTIGPNTTLWFYFDYVTEIQSPGGFGSRGGRGSGASIRTTANVAVDANGAQGLEFAIYTPVQAKDWMNDPETPPVGRGTPQRDGAYDTIAHDLYWSGGFNTTGRYFIALSNKSAVPITYRMTVTGQTVTLYPVPTVAPTPTLPVPFTVTPVPTGTIPGKVVFETTTGGEIYTVSGDGSNLTRVSHGIDPSWSPDGKQIAFARWDNTAPGLFIANADGSNERHVFVSQRLRWPRWSPDGQYMVFSQDKSTGDNNTVWKLGVVEIATGKLTEPQCSQLCYVPSWSSDGKTIIYTDPSRGILAANVSQGPASLIGPTGRYWDSAANISRPIVNWPPIQGSETSPDGRRIIYSMQAHDRWELNAMNIDGGDQAGITKPDVIQYYVMGIPFRNVAPTWSPNSQQLLFLSDRNGKWEFFVTDLSGTEIRQVLKSVTDRVSIQFGYANERIMDWTE